MGPAPPSPGDLLDAWEAGRCEHHLARPLLLLAACGAGDPARLAAEPLGTTDRRLWELRAALAGTGVSACADCPACGEPVDLEFDGRTLADGADEPGAGGPVRPLCTADLLAVVDAPDPVRVLAERCGVPRERAEEASDLLLAADPGAETLLDLACPACGNRWSAPFDIGAFVWTEVERLSARLLADVGTLARHYGWTEDETLALSPARRRLYVEMAAG